MASQERFPAVGAPTWRGEGTEGQDRVGRSAEAALAVSELGECICCEYEAYHPAKVAAHGGGRRQQRRRGQQRRPWPVERVGREQQATAAEGRGRHGALPHQLPQRRLRRLPREGMEGDRQRRRLGRVLGGHRRATQIPHLSLRPRPTCAPCALYHAPDSPDHTADQLQVCRASALHLPPAVAPCARRLDPRELRHHALRRAPADQSLP